MVEEAKDDGGSTSEDEIISMCRNNLVHAENSIVQLVPILGMYSDNYFVKLPKRVNGDFGMDWVMDTLARDTQCYNMFRVERPLFNRLHNTLVQSYGLKSTTKMTSIEALAMFLWIVGSPQSVRQAENRLRRSLETISRTFNRVLTCLLRLAHDIIVPKDPTFSEVHPNLENPAFWPHFNDCIGAIDGTHVNVVVPKSKRVPYLNRHNETSQNVLVVCDFDMRFTFVLLGWPGSAHDMRVFKGLLLELSCNNL
ncbi:protein ALP1-like [Oryza sativa Japonica Group]|uniref:protein ALP1-like n=1 Tax=Oryza sativa subsp. japonica TaxID=39947 RepID=UPI00077548EB|nr:protein ALP1-like [Oryza sativa Japonica Group]